MKKDKFDVYKLKQVIAEIAKDYNGSLSFSDVFHAQLVSLDPLTFIRDDNIVLVEKFLVVPKYRKFTEEEIGNYFVFQSNHENQVHYYQYEASSPQGSNGVDYHWKGKNESYIDSCRLIGTCSCGGTVIVTHGKIFEETIEDCVHDCGIKKCGD